MTGPSDPLGRRSLFSAPNGPAANDTAPNDTAPNGPAPNGASNGAPNDLAPGARPAPGATSGTAPRQGSDGRRALFSNPQARGRSVLVTCRTCRARTPLSLSAMARRLVPSVWLPVSRWSRWMRCPSCGAFSWCRVEWRGLLSGR